MTNAEIRWTKYLTKGLPLFTDKIIEVFVKTQANSVCKNLKIDKLYGLDVQSPLNKVLRDHLKGGDISSRSNFFETNVAEYSKGSLKMDI